MSTVHQYALHFGFREPYQVLRTSLRCSVTIASLTLAVDAEIIRDAARFKMNFIGGLEKALHGPVKPSEFSCDSPTNTHTRILTPCAVITQCSIRHLYASESGDSAVLEHAKAFERRRCNHHTLEQPLSSLECLSSVVDPKGSKTNKNRYVVASQDDKVRAYMRTVPGVPLIYIKRSVMIMEPMAAATENVTAKEERLKFRHGLKEQKGSGRGVKRGRGEDEDAQDTGGETLATKILPSAAGEPQPPKKKRKRGPSGPNPLSVKKAKEKKPTTHTAATARAAPANAEAKAQVVNPPAMEGTVAPPLDEIARHKRKRRHKPGKENVEIAATVGP